jgi:hypothetical protein
LCIPHVTPRKGGWISAGVEVIPPVRIAAIASLGTTLIMMGLL